MKAPDKSDRFVKVGAYLTDELFGYDHWRAGQFMTPDGAIPAVLIICKDTCEQAEALKFLQDRQATIGD